MSSDGSDSEGSLAEFILGSEDEEGGEVPAVDEEPENEAQTLAQELTPEERALMAQKQEEGAPRRSRRARKAPVRYVDDKYAELMLTKGGAADLDDVMAPSSDEEEPAAESDDDFQADGSESDDESEEEEEEGVGAKRSVALATSSPRKRARSSAE